MLCQALRSATNRAAIFSTSASRPNGAKALFGFRNQGLQPRLGAVEAEDADERALAASRRPCRSPCRRSRRRPRRRAGRRRSGTLRRATCRSVSSACALRGRRFAEDRACDAAKAQQRAGLHRLQQLRSRLRRASAPCRRRSGLPPRGRASVRRPCRRGPSRARAPARGRCAPPGSDAFRCARQNVERQRQQSVAREDRGRLVELLVRGRPPAPQVVVVHRRAGRRAPASSSARTRARRRPSGRARAAP